VLRTADRKRLGGKGQYGFVGRGGEPLVRAKVRSGFIRSSGDVEITRHLDEGDAIVVALLACYLLIRRNEEAAAGAAASTAATAA
jgi:hypothetical protein